MESLRCQVAQLRTERDELLTENRNKTKQIRVLVQAKVRAERQCEQEHDAVRHLQDIYDQMNQHFGNELRRLHDIIRNLRRNEDLATPPRPHEEADAPSITSGDDTGPALEADEGAQIDETIPEDESAASDLDDERFDSGVPAAGSLGSDAESDVGYDEMCLLNAELQEHVIELEEQLKRVRSSQVTDEPESTDWKQQLSLLQAENERLRDRVIELDDVPTKGGGSRGSSSRSTGTRPATKASRRRSGSTRSSRRSNS
jgi:hypothetical protein